MKREFSTSISLVFRIIKYVQDSLDPLKVDVQLSTKIKPLTPGV